MVQGSSEWLMERCGKVTASRVGDIMAKTKSGYSAGRANYMAQLLCERMTGSVEESFKSEAMRWGTEKEPEARSIYEALNLTVVEEYGFGMHPEIPYFGASPDGLIGEDGGLEIKCPNTATHIETLLDGTVKRQYLLQMQTAMAVFNREWWDFVSYDPRMADGLKIWVKRVDRDNSLIAEIESEVIKFNAELEAKIEQLQKMKEEA